MAISKLEQETVILYNEEEDTATVYTCSRKLKNKLLALREQRPQEVTRAEDDGECGITFTVPKKWIKVSPVKKVSDAQRERMSKIAKQRHEKER